MSANLYADFLRDHCDGSGPHSGVAVRLYPLGGGANLILCMACASKENRYRFNRGREFKNPENWPQVNWHQCEVYATASESQS